MLQVVRIDAPYGDRVPKMPAQDWNYHRDLVGETRTDVKPLNVVQPEGPSFQVGWGGCWTALTDSPNVSVA